MADSTILDPVSEDDPCGPDMRWDPDFVALEHAFDLAASSADDVVDGEAEPTVGGGFQDIISSAEKLCAGTKDMRILTLRAEACWRHAGLAAFAGAVTDLAAVAEAWPDPDAGFHPRADEEDGDMSERNAPLTKLVGRIPILVEVVGWGSTPPPPAVQQEVREALGAVFDAWTSRLETAFGRDLVSVRDAWAAVRKLVGDAAPPVLGNDDPAEDATHAGAVAAPGDAVANAWDALDRALELMALQNGHSPAIPVLRLLSTWRDADIIDIVETMRDAGVTLEQLLDAVKKRLDTA